MYVGIATPVSRIETTTCNLDFILVKLSINIFTVLSSTTFMTFSKSSPQSKIPTFLTRGRDFIHF